MWNNSLRFYKGMRDKTTLKILVICFLLGVNLFGKTYQVTSRQIDIYTNITGTAKIDSLNKYALNLKTSNPQLRKTIGRISLELSKTSNYELGILQALNNIGVGYQELGKRDSSIIFYKKAFEYASKLENIEWIANISSNIGTGYSHYNQFDSALVYLKKSMISAVLLKDTILIGNLFNRMGVTYWRKGEFNEALKLYKLALKSRRAVGDNVLISQSLNNIGTAYFNLGNYKIALEYYIEAVNVWKTYSDLASPILLNNIGLIYLRLKDIPLAKKYFNSGLENAKILEKVIGKGYSYLNLGDLNSMNSNYESAIEYYRKSKKFYKELNDINGVVKINNKIGKVYLETNQLELAEKMFLEAYKASKKKGLKLTQTESQINYCKILILKEKFNASLTNLKHAYKLAKEGHFVNSTLMIYYLQTEVYEKLGKFKIALEYHKKYNLLKDSLFNENSLRIVSETKERYEAKEREEKNLKLHHINSLQKIELENRKNIMIFVLPATAVLFFVLIYLVYINIQRRKKNEALLLAKKDIETINKKLNDTNKLLKQSNFTKDKFFSIISHDLKNPFNTLLGAAEILQSDFDEMSMEENKELIDIILKDSQKLYSLLENLLYWANSQTGNLKAKKTNILLYNIVSEIVALYSTSAMDKNINIKVEIPKAIVVVFDKFMLSTIIRNILSNAIKFTHSGGEILISTKKDNGKILLKVKDEGIGIEKQNLQKLFNENSNYRALGTNNEKGTGLGLILCNDFVKENNAEIKVISEFGKGTTFVLFLEKK